MEDQWVIISNLSGDFTVVGGDGGCKPGGFVVAFIKEAGCTFLSNCGATIEELKVRGDWVSDTVLQYLQTPLQVRIMNDLRVATALSTVTG